MDLPELFKVTRYVDKYGKRCTKITVGARATKSDCWYAEVKPIESPADRIARRKAGLSAPKRKRVKLCSNKDAARRMLEAIKERDEKIAAGLIVDRPPAVQAFGEILELFEQHLRQAGKSKTDHYIKTTMNRVTNVLAGCGFLQLADIDCQQVEAWLHDRRNEVARSVSGTARNYREIAEAFEVATKTITSWRQKGAPITPRAESYDLKAISSWHQETTRTTSIGTTTNDHYVTALKRFGNWMRDKAEIVSVNPFNKLDKMNDQTEIRKDRRIIEPGQFAALITAASESDKTYRGLNGSDRAMIYVLACFTGLRAGEIGSLRSNSFDFGDSPMVRVEAAYTKNGKVARIPLKADLADRLQTYLEGGARTTVPMNGKAQRATLIWPGTWKTKAAAMIRLDLKSAEIEYTVDGSDYDFHALRHQFITNMFRAGIPLKVAQELARHSKPELTANIYAHLSAKDRSTSIEKLGAIPSITSEPPRPAYANAESGRPRLRVCG